MAQGLMRKLTLDISGVMKSIDDLQKGIANLGKGNGNGNVNIPGIDALKKDLQSVLPILNQIDTQLKSLGSGGSDGDGKVKENTRRVSE